MGAPIVLAVLVIAGLYVPHSHKTQANTLGTLAPSTSVIPNPEKLPPTALIRTNRSLPRLPAVSTMSSQSTQPPALPTATTTSGRTRIRHPRRLPLRLLVRRKQSHPTQADSSSVKPTRPSPKSSPPRTMALRARRPRYRGLMQARRRQPLPAIQPSWTSWSERLTGSPTARRR